MFWLFFACAASEPGPVRDGQGLWIEQIGLSDAALGEAALLVAEDGTSLLVDVGNDSHADEVVDAVDRAGLDGVVDYVLLTHLHADHIGAMDKLFGEDGALAVEEAIVWRGPVHTEDANAGEVDGLEEALAQQPGLALCDQDGCALPWEVPLGDATLSVWLADGWLAVSGRPASTATPRARRRSTRCAPTSARAASGRTPPVSSAATTRCSRTSVAAWSSRCRPTAATPSVARGSASG